jgi:hypothetical protein
MAKSGDKWGYINTKGEWAIEPSFDEVGFFAENGLAVVQHGIKYGYIDRKGEWAIKPSFVVAGSFDSAGLAMVGYYGNNGYKYSYINTKGKLVAKPFAIHFYDRLPDFSSEGITIVRRGEKFGYVNMEGEWLIPPWYEDAGTFYYGLAGVEIGGQGRTIDPTGTYRVYGVYQADKNKGQLQWKVKRGKQYLYKQNGQRVLYIETICDTQVVKNAKGQITWPEKSKAQICEAQSAEE